MAAPDYWKSRVETSQSSGSSYWRGTYAAQPQEHSDVGHDASAGRSDSTEGREGDEQPATHSGVQREPLHYGSVSARARQAYAAEALRHKDHISAGLLAIFLGIFGIHKFYLGCNQAGFIMLAVSIIGGILTLGLAAAVIWVIAAIEGIIYLTKTQTQFDQIYVLHQRDWF